MGLEPVVYRNFIDEELRLYLKDYAESLLNQGLTWPNAFDDKRRLFVLRGPSFINEEHKLQYITKPIEDLYNRIVDTLQLTNPVLDTQIGTLISILQPGSHIHSHKDVYMNKPNMVNYRFNVMVQRNQDISYNPIIGDVSYDIQQGDAWSFNATDNKHSTLYISGPENRVVYQFGFTIDRNSL